MLAQLIAVAPMLVIACAITLGMLLIAITRSQRLIHAFSAISLLIAAVITILLLSNSPVQVTPLVNVTSFGLYAQLLILVSALMTTLLSYQFLLHQIEVHDEYYLLILLAVLGAMLLVVSDHFAAIFLGFELLSISLVGLVGYCREARLSVETGFKYLVLSAVASSIMLLGIAFIYGDAGTLSVSLLQDKITGSNHFYIAGLMLFFIGIAFKLSLVPFHLWVADVYQGANTLITMFMATVSKIAMFVVMYLVSKNILFATVSMGYQFIIVLAVLSMIVGNVLAIHQCNIKRILAYSSIAHMGYLLVILVASNKQAFIDSDTIALFYLAVYGLATISIFYVVYKLNGAELNEPNQGIEIFTALFWRHKLFAVLMTLSLLSLAGVPLTGGFFGKFYLVGYVTVISEWALLAAIILGSGLGIYVYLKLIVLIFMNVQENQEITDAKSTVRYSPLLVQILIFLSLFVGVYPEVLMRFITVSG